MATLAAQPELSLSRFVLRNGWLAICMRMPAAPVAPAHSTAPAPIAGATCLGEDQMAVDTRHRAHGA